MTIEIRKIIDIVRDNPGITPWEIGELIGEEDRTINKELASKISAKCHTLQRQRYLRSETTMVVGRGGLHKVSRWYVVEGERNETINHLGTQIKMRLLPNQPS